MKVFDIMKANVLMVRADLPLKKLWQMITKRHVNALPVVDGKKQLLGIVTKDDILRTLYPDYQEYFEDITTISDFEEMEDKVQELVNIKTKSIMCKRVIFTRADTPVMRALSRMIRNGVDQLPVLAYNNDTVVGWITKGDIFRALFKGKSGSTAPKKRATQN